ncbi:transglycosylase domain-containing protein [Primorskyibacter sedentarius]|uniref:transglycosylase domain-containing protein n=1 Tax=Primorskyibacter sedentarius TaxID=745311 RepID=UPI003EB94065
MSDSGKGRGRLVADRRYPKSRATAKAAKKPVRAKAKPKKTARKRAPARKRNPIAAFIIGIFAWSWRLIWRLTSRVALVVVLILALSVGYFYTKLPDITALLDGRARGSVTLLDRNGEVFAWRGDQFGGVVTASSVSPHLKNAVVATEDKRFYWHPGIDPIGIASAIRINLREGRGPLSGHGGSTLSQQTAKLLCLGVEYDPTQWKDEAEYVQDCRRGSLSRKLKEALYALAMEVKFTKDEILSIYLNRAYLGGGAYGAEAAAQRYFGKPASALNPAEAAMIAGLLTAPTTLSPTNNLERSQNRANVVIGLMEAQDYLTDAEASNARANPARLSEAAEAKAGGYFADWVMDSGPEFFTRKTSEDVIIGTTLDQRLQEAAEQAMISVFENKVRAGSKAQAAIVVMSSDGAVRAMVGGRKTRVTGAFNRATQARRQVGSAFKPFVFATALELGYSPYDIVVDEPLTLNVPGSGPWSPQNYTKTFKGRVTLIEALEDSLNIPAVKISESVGRDLVIRVAEDFGFGNDISDTPAMALGTSESTLLEMTGAYAGILNGGSSVTPYGLVELHLRGDDDPLMDITGGIGERVIRKEAAGQLIFMMEKVVSEGTGRRARLEGRQAAGKTGTTQAARDAWFVGFTADYVAGVWMGYDDNTPLTGVTGGGLPAEIWRETMERVHAGLPARPLPMVVPEPPRRAPAPAPQPAPQPQPQKRKPTVLQQLLNDLLGGN